ncbi:hypothetical protein D3C77_651130 [compost metagenome]
MLATTDEPATNVVTPCLALAPSFTWMPFPAAVTANEPIAISTRPVPRAFILGLIFGSEPRAESVGPDPAAPPVRSHRLADDAV